MMRTRDANLGLDMWCCWGLIIGILMYCFAINLFFWRSVAARPAVQHVSNFA